jgi:hypothetical protein
VMFPDITLDLKDQAPDLRGRLIRTPRSPT